MMIHPWDSASEGEWRSWLAAGHTFGNLTVNSSPWALVVPTHFTLVGDDEIVLHLARPNGAREAILADPHVVLTVSGDEAYIPSTWRVEPGVDPATGVPTSYYAAVQLRCVARLVDDPAEKAAILRLQLADLQPEGGHGTVAEEHGPYHRMLPGIVGLRLTVVEVLAKFKYDDHKPANLRADIAGRLEQRAERADRAAHAQQVRRLGQPELRT